MYILSYDILMLIQVPFSQKEFFSLFMITEILQGEL